MKELLPYNNLWRDVNHKEHNDGVNDNIWWHEFTLLRKDSNIWREGINGYSIK